MTFIDTTEGEINVHRIVSYTYVPKSHRGNLPPIKIIYTDADNAAAVAYTWGDPAEDAGTYVKADPGYYLLQQDCPEDREPVVAWKIIGRCAEPVGLVVEVSLAGEWAVLTPTGTVVTNDGAIYPSVGKFREARPVREPYEVTPDAA